ncbi:hypothetical protein [Microcoleus sp. M2_C6]
MGKLLGNGHGALVIGLQLIAENSLTIASDNQARIDCLCPAPHAFEQSKI